MKDKEEHNTEEEEENKGDKLVEKLCREVTKGRM